MGFQVVENKIALQKKHVLVGNNDEITDLEWVGPIESPSHICVATNSTHLRLFDMASMNCTATMAGHSDAILCTAASRMGDDTTLIVSGVVSGPVPNSMLSEKHSKSFLSTFNYIDIRRTKHSPIVDLFITCMLWYVLLNFLILPL